MAAEVARASGMNSAARAGAAGPQRRLHGRRGGAARRRACALQPGVSSRGSRVAWAWRPSTAATDPSAGRAAMAHRAHPASSARVRGKPRPAGRGWIFGRPGNKRNRAAPGPDGPDTRLAAERTASRPRPRCQTHGFTPRYGAQRAEELARLVTGGQSTVTTESSTFGVVLSRGFIPGDSGLELGVPPLRLRSKYVELAPLQLIGDVLRLATECRDAFLALGDR
jgi:hypothetical protein